MLHKAEENLRCSKVALQKRLFNASVSRSYYAMFQSCLYLLDSVGALPKHYGEEKWEHYRVPQVMKQFVYLPEELKKDLEKTRERRVIADYRPWDISGNIARETYKKAKRFMEWVNERIGRS